MIQEYTADGWDEAFSRGSIATSCGWFPSPLIRVICRYLVYTDRDKTQAFIASLFCAGLQTSFIHRGLLADVKDTDRRNDIQQRTLRRRRT